MLMQPLEDYKPLVLAGGDSPMEDIDATATAAPQQHRGLGTVLLSDRQQPLVLSHDTTRQAHTLWTVRGDAEWHVDKQTAFKFAEQKIGYGLELNVGKEEQAKIYIDQLDTIEKVLVECGNDINKVTKKLDSAELLVLPIFQSLETPNDKNLYMIWVLNICALRIMNKIPNDNNNGCLTMTDHIFSMLE